MAVYHPKFQPQLGRSPWASTDCGIRSTQMSIDDASEGKRVPSVERIREVIKDYDATNYDQWDKAIDVLGGPVGVHGENTNKVAEVIAHLKAGYGLVAATDYGVLRRKAPALTGSETFDGYHAIFLEGMRKNASGQWVVRDLDPLNDGRYQGCPRGPVMMPWAKVKAAMEAISTGKVFATLVFPDGASKGAYPGEPIPEPEPAPTMFSLLADMRQARFDGIKGLDAIIEQYETLLGIADLPAEDSAIIEQAFNLPTE